VEEARIIAPTEPGKTTDLFDRHGYDLSLKRSLRSPYLLANIVYVIYTALIIDIDVNVLTIPEEQLNNMYIAANCIHLTNGMMYMWVWWHEGFRGKMLGILLVPEFLNLMEASLYITSSTFYGSENPDPYNLDDTIPYNASYYVFNTTTCSYPDNGTYVYFQDIVAYNVQNIEMTASIVAMVAALGWTFTWYLTYRRIPGRGWTLDDPDVWSLVTILIGDIMYIIYNCMIISDRESYGTNYFYVAADWVFVVNSWLYVACALRDAGWFFQLPTAGRMHFDDKYELKAKKEKILKDVI